MGNEQFAGFRIARFTPVAENALQQIAERLIPNQEEIIDVWIQRQWDAWQPPGLTRDGLHQVFGGIWRKLLRRMEARELQQSLIDLEEAGRGLARQQFPFEALVISVHFLEASYLPFLIGPLGSGGGSQSWLIAMDEFLHAALASIATAYFEQHRRDLLDEVEIGRIVQEGLLADIPRRTGDLEVAHIYISAREHAQVGGDFLDFFTLNRGGVAFVIGDMSGHGLDAAADSMMLRSLFRGFMHEDPNPAGAMERVNRVLAFELASDQFATALAVTYFPSGLLHLVSAGHPCPVLCGTYCQMLEPEGIVLAVDPEAGYDTHDIQIELGGAFVAYTDGLIEAGGCKNQFGEERLMREVSSVVDASARSIAEHLVDASLRHSGGRFEDDVAVLVLKRSKLPQD